MSRLHTIDVNEATGELAELFGAIKKSVGRVPNAFATLGSKSPALLAQALQMGAMLQTKSALSKQHLQAINLAISEDSSCDYCVAAHTLMGKAAAFSADQGAVAAFGELPRGRQDRRPDQICASPRGQRWHPTPFMRSRTSARPASMIGRLSRPSERSAQSCSPTC